MRSKGVAPFLGPLLLGVILSACDPGLSHEDYLPLGEMPKGKADGDWGYAEQCKEIPSLPGLIKPRITISLNGLTLHLEDLATQDTLAEDWPNGFSRVYPIGVGKINDSVGQTTSNESLTMYPVLSGETNEFAIKTANVNPCTIWWTEPETGDRLPVFAGLPFMSFHGPYGIHGPITGYTAENGGELKRGYVSHGCVRMEAKDVAEVWAYIRDHDVVPVRVQKAAERMPNEKSVDLDQKWILSECEKDDDCNFAAGFCKQNSVSGRGFCTASCDRYCNYDKFGYPETFCVKDPDGNSQGYCTYKASGYNYNCRRFDAFKKFDNEPRFNEPSVTANVCKPKSQ
ncbi:MAG: L,D-transpeptidase, partial [Pseudomonadota bacterium]